MNFNPTPAKALLSCIPLLKFLSSCIPPPFLISSCILPNLCWTLSKTPVFLQHVAANCNRGGNMCNDIFQFAMQHCCETSCEKMLFLLLCLKDINTQVDLGLDCIWKVDIQVLLPVAKGGTGVLTVNMYNHLTLCFSFQMSPSQLVTASLFYWTVATPTVRGALPNGLDYTKHRSCVQNVRTPPSLQLKGRRGWRASHPISTC